MQNIGAGGGDSVDTWAVEYNDVLRSIPETVRKSKETRASPYKPQRSKRSPIQTSTRFKQPDGNARRQDDSGDEEETPPSPTPTRSIRTDEKTSLRQRGRVRPEEAQDGKGGWQYSQTKRHNIQDRPFCTPKCLRGNWSVI